MFRCCFEWTLELQPTDLPGLVQLDIELCRVKGVVSSCRSRKYKSGVKGDLVRPRDNTPLAMWSSVPEVVQFSLDTLR